VLKSASRTIVSPKNCAIRGTKGNVKLAFTIRNLCVKIFSASETSEQGFPPLEIKLLAFSRVSRPEDPGLEQICRARILFGGSHGPSLFSPLLIGWCCLKGTFHHDFGALSSFKAQWRILELQPQNPSHIHGENSTTTLEIRRANGCISSAPYQMAPTLLSVSSLRPRAEDRFCPKKRALYAQSRPTQEVCRAHAR